MSIDKKTRYEISEDSFWGLLIFLLLFASCSLIYGISESSKDYFVLSAVLLALALLRFIVKPRPPKFIIVDPVAREIEIFLKRKPKYEKFKLDEIQSVRCFVRPARFPMAELEIILIGNLKKQYFFEAEMRGESFFSLKDCPSEQLSELVETTNCLLRAQ